MDRTDRKAEKHAGAEAHRFARAHVAVYKRLKAVVAFPIVLAFGATIVVLLLPERYDSAATIQVDPRQRSNAAIVPGSAEPESSQPTIEAELQTLKSEPVIRRAVQSLRLDQDEDFKSPWPEILFASLFGATSLAQTEAAVRSRLLVSRLRNTLLVKIRISSDDPKKSARVANAIADAYLKDHAEANASRQAAASIMGQQGGGDAKGGGTPTASERVFESLLAQYGQALELPGPRLVAKAKPPSKPAAPKRTRIVAITFTLGLIGAIGTALLLEFRLSARTRGSRVRATFSCTHMTSLPAILRNVSMPSRACRFVLAEPTGDYASAVRQTCRELEKRRNGAPSRLTLVVSALPGEGAECLASNIAHQYAMAGHSPLLVDADLRMKTLTRQLASESPTGLLDQIAGNQAIESAILRDCATGLHFLPASGPAPIPMPVQDVLHSKAFADAINMLKQNFVTIVLSAPPLLTATDALILAEMADEIVFATAWQRTPARLAKKALASIAAYQDKIAGAALTEIVEREDTSIMSLYEVLEEMRSAAALSAFKANAA
jgi:Mrp family chromosome partitioning ATPase/capsular polysaccharide biosynthesis protein